MPVTAKLSRKFYDQFGDDIVAELVELLNQVDAASHAQLREFNELNFARFDAKVGERFAEFEARVNQRFVELEARIDHRLVELEARIDHRLVELEARIDHRLVELEARFDRKLAELEARLRAEIHAQVTAASGRLLRWMIGLWITQTLMFFGLWMQRG